MTNVGRWREPVIPGYVPSRAQIAWARSRPPGQRTALPQVGEEVGVRLLAGGPVLPGRILFVDLDPPSDTRAGTEIDSNVWRYVVTDHARGPVEIDEAGNRAVELVGDPWPSVLVEVTQGPPLRTETREARLPGSPGWLRGQG